MYFSELIESQDREVRTRKILSDVLKIDSNINLKPEEKTKHSTIELLSSVMIKKIKQALK